jgi:hypothetical protein
MLQPLVNLDKLHPQNCITGWPSTWICFRSLIIVISLLKSNSSHLCFAAMQRIWSSKIKRAESKGTRLVEEPDDNGRWIVIWRQRESSLSPVTSISWNHITSHIQNKNLQQKLILYYNNIAGFNECGLKSQSFNTYHIHVTGHNLKIIQIKKKDTAVPVHATKVYWGLEVHP